MTPYLQDIKAIHIPHKELEALRGKNILVAGATGLVGGALIDLLMCYAAEYQFTVYAGYRNIRHLEHRFAPYLQSRNFKGVVLDVLKPIEAETPFHFIVHAASNANPALYATDPIGTMKGNIEGVDNLMQYGIRHHLERFLFISSGEVYGEGCRGEWSESDSGYVDSMQARSCYPSSKRAAETLCVAYAEQYGVSVSVARLSHVYGPYFTAGDNRVYAQFLRNALQGEDIVLKSKGEQYRSWLYAADCAAALFYILAKGASKEAYNVADEQSNVTIKALAELVASMADRQVVFDLPSEIEKKGGTPITKAVFSTQKLRGLGWHPQFSLEEGMRHTLDTLR